MENSRELKIDDTENTNGEPIRHITKFWVAMLYAIGSEARKQPALPEMLDRVPTIGLGYLQTPKIGAENFRYKLTCLGLKKLQQLNFVLHAASSLGPTVAFEKLTVEAKSNACPL